tara:strand:- start:1780 stop:2046 length:267 start_codon:yes stop_codon:yes gene_type:complete
MSTRKIKKEQIIMAKNKKNIDAINLIIAKSLSSQFIEEDELHFCQDLSLSLLINEHGLTDEQSKQVLNWCLLSQRKIRNEFRNTHETK